MNAESLKKVDSNSTESQTSSGWDPFIVWRERVHKPRAESKRPTAAATPRETATNSLRLLKQSG
jgi:hypothetical protein